MHPYKEILNLKNDQIAYELHPVGNVIKLQNKNFPWSIKQFEFDMIRSLITTCDLKCGLEIGTGFGVSAVAAGLGFKDTGGKLVTVDSYIEDLHDNYITYRRVEPSTFPNSVSFQSTKFLLNHFELNDVVYPELGWTPRDTFTILKKHLGDDKKLDFVFLDGGEFPEQVVKDVESVLPFLATNYVVVLQGVYDNVYDPAVIARLRRVLRKDPVYFVDPNLPLTNRLGIVWNL